MKLFNDVSTPTLKLTFLTIFFGLTFVIITPLFYLTDFVENLNNNFIGFNYIFKNRLNIGNSIDIYYSFRTILLIPILEELYYRRIIQKMISEKYNSVIAILISSLLFSLGHMDIEHIYMAFISGIILGYFYLKTKNIIMPILLHSLFNILILISKEKIVYLEGLNYFYLIIYPIAIYIIIHLTKKVVKISN